MRMRKSFLFVVVGTIVALVASAFGGVPPASRAQEVAPSTGDVNVLEAPVSDSYIVRLADGVSAGQAGLSALGEVSEYPPIGGFSFAVVKPNDDGQMGALEAMVNGAATSSTGILYVEKEAYAVLQISWETDDPMYQWANGAGGLGGSFPKTGTKKPVAVIDTGQARAHEDLPVVPASDRITVQNGRIIYGSCTDTTGEGHGTHVTGIVAMTHNNQKGGAGVMTQTGRILCIKSFHGFSASWADIAWGVLYAGVEGAKYLNASWGGTGESRLVADAIGFYLAQGDSYFIAACGNYGSWYPGCIFPASLAGKPGFERLISVGALNAGLNPASFSQYGGTVWAPGEMICSTFPTNGYKCWSGTSMAAPYALGVIASMLERRPLGEGETLIQRLQTCSLRLQFGGLFPRWECVGGANEVFLPLVSK